YNSEPIVINPKSFLHFNPSSSFNQMSIKYQDISTPSFPENIECKQEIRRNMNASIFIFENYAIGSLFFIKKTPYDVSIGCFSMGLSFNDLFNNSQSEPYVNSGIFSHFVGSHPVKNRPTSIPSVIASWLGHSYERVSKAGPKRD